MMESLHLVAMIAQLGCQLVGGFEFFRGNYAEASCYLIVGFGGDQQWT